MKLQPAVFDGDEICLFSEGFVVVLCGDLEELGGGFFFGGCSLHEVVEDCRGRDAVIRQLPQFTRTSADAALPPMKTIEINGFKLKCKRRWDSDTTQRKHLEKARKVMRSIKGSYRRLGTEKLVKASMGSSVEMWRVCRGIPTCSHTSWRVRSVKTLSSVWKVGRKPPWTLGRSPTSSHHEYSLRDTHHVKSFLCSLKGLGV